MFLIWNKRGAFNEKTFCNYSGFADAFSGRDNTSAMTSEFGKRSGNSYSVGYKRGRKAAFAYFKKTGKQPFDLKQEIYRKT